MLALVLVSLTLSAGCNSEGYCIDCFDAEGLVGLSDGGGGDDAAIDADIRDAAPGDACVSSGIEQCDDLDNDCDGIVDEGDLPGVDVNCGTNVGECQAGTTICDQGSIVCGGGAINETFELCNTLDDDCDGMTDENNPEGGLVCGTNVGECQAGVTLCSGGTLSCDGEVIGGSESCNGLDDDCDGNFDEGITVAGDCGPSTDVGLCTFGTQTCVGGSIQCVGATLAQIEQCDNMDHDCDGDPLNGFDLQGDAQNCGGCGTVCDEPNAFMQCVSGACEIAACQTDFHDNDPAIDGCEFGPCTFAGSEICNGEDDDCDGSVDEDVVTPALLCDQDGECNGATASCDGVNGFVCNYGPTVTTDAGGNIVAETDCDELDNDCDGSVDEAFPSKGDDCDDGDQGVCRDTGTIVCTASDDDVECTAVDVINPGNAPVEACNDFDDDCDGNVDEGDLQDWVAIGGGFEIMKYEASRPDSDATEQGFVIDASVCSEQGRVPWTNITQPEAEAACGRIGARLCSEAEWLLSCETDNAPPATTQQGSNNLIVIEAETGTVNSDWAVGNTQPGFSGTGYLQIPDDSISSEFDPSNLDSSSPRIDFTVNFNTTGTHFLWVRMFADDDPDNPDLEDDSAWFAFDDTDGNLAGSTGGEPYLDLDTINSWDWLNTYNGEATRITFDVTTTGNHTLSFYHSEDALIIDRIVVTTDADFVPLGTGPADQCAWSYETDCKVYQPGTCNGEDFDGDSATAGDQDLMLATGTMNACFAEWEGGGDAFDLSGNVKEWTAERTPGVNPLRGGSFNNTEVGISCQFDFLTADDDFFLPNIGFRCCR